MPGLEDISISSVDRLAPPPPLALPGSSFVPCKKEDPTFRPNKPTRNSSGHQPKCPLRSDPRRGIQAQRWT